MGKKKSREKYVSKGIVGHPRRTRATGFDKMMNKLKAWQQGKPVKLTLYGYKTTALEAWGDPKKRANIFGNDEEK